VILDVQIKGLLFTFVRLVSGIKKIGRAFEHPD
jgi:hypothetical protein